MRPKIATGTILSDIPQLTIFLLCGLLLALAPTIIPITPINPKRAPESKVINILYIPIIKVRMDNVLFTFTSLFLLMVIPPPIHAHFFMDSHF